MSSPHAAPPRIQVAVEYADPLVAIGLSTVLSQQLDIDLVDAPRPSPWPGLATPQIVVADYARGMHLAARRRAPGRGPAAAAGLRVLVVTAQDREQAVRQALEAGVDGYLELGCDVQEFICGVRQRARGARYLSATAARRVADSMARSALTAREREVLGWVVLGRSNKAIALQLEVSLGTVKAHMKALMGKLDAATRTEAANVAVERGLVAAGE